MISFQLLCFYPFSDIEPFLVFELSEIFNIDLLFAQLRTFESLLINNVNDDVSLRSAVFFKIQFY